MVDNVSGVLQMNTERARVNETVERLRERNGRYRHEIQGWLINPYRAVRLHNKWGFKKMCELLGLKPEALKYRERIKQSFYLLEIVMLFEVSQMTPEEFVEMLRDIA